MKNKRSLFIVVAMVLLLAVVLGMGGTTFAKYITTASVEDQTATVAKWGYVVTIDAEDGGLNTIFGTDYSETDTDKLATIVATDSGVAVNAASTNNVVAPGTTGFFKIAVNGAAEVRSKLTIDMTVVDDVYLAPEDGGTASTGYNPIVWRVTDDKNSNAELFKGTLAQLAEWLDGNEHGKNTTSAVNTPIDFAWTVTWTWAFEKDGATNVMDTALGNIVADLEAAIAEDPAATIADVTQGDTTITFSFDLAVTVEQVQ